MTGKMRQGGTWHVVAGLVTPGRSLVDSLPFLVPSASADPQCRGLAGIRQSGCILMAAGSPRRKFMLLHVFSGTAIKLGYRKMDTMGDLDQQRIYDCWGTKWLSHVFQVHKLPIEPDWCGRTQKLKMPLEGRGVPGSEGQVESIRYLCIATT